MSNIDKQALRKRYSAKPTPKCDICGARMTIQRMSGSRVTYGCSGAIYDETGCHYAEGRSLADDHYEQSRVTVTDESDPDVLALLDELEAIQKTSAERLVAIDTTHKMFQRERDRADAAEKRSAELSQKADIYDMLRQDYGLQGSLVDFVDWQAKRIAELSASHGKLREAMAGIHNTITARGAYTPLAAILNASKRAYEESSAAAGKGEAS